MILDIYLDGMKYVAVLAAAGGLFVGVWAIAFSQSPRETREGAQIIVVGLVISILSPVWPLLAVAAVAGGLLWVVGEAFDL